jgi:hypothetical protein
VAQAPRELGPGRAVSGDDLISAPVLDDDARREELWFLLRLAKELEMVLEYFVPA